MAADPVTECTNPAVDEKEVMVYLCEKWSFG